LALDGYKVRRASDTAELRAVCGACTVELVIFGRATRRGAGLDVLRNLRAGALMPEAKPGLRALWISPNGDLGDVLRGFEAGADDVLRAPFAYSELRARVQALVRRDLGEELGVIEYGELRIDTTAHEVIVGVTPVALRRLEFALLVHIARDPVRVYTKDELMREVWGFRSPGTTRTLDCHASRLRRKPRPVPTGWYAPCAASATASPGTHSVLRRAGLIHRWNDLATPSRPAVRLHEISQSKSESPADDDRCESAVLTTLLRRTTAGEAPLTDAQVHDALSARKRKQQTRIGAALHRLDAAGLIERRGEQSIASEVAMHFDHLMTP
jgi:DNA-binding response OmpR family regulator